MTRDDQKRIVTEMCDGLRETLVSFIEEGRVPEAWNGLELRQLFADLAAERYACDRLHFNGITKRRYKNERLVRGL